MSEIEDMIKANIWHEDLSVLFSEVLALLAKERDEWVWYKNGPCKYINIKIDMRDGGYILMDRDGGRISLDELKEQ